ncbi:SDR family NAD(P)-dependent oxidoreductase [Microbacterium sp. RD1]|uniref:SDR family NAD(P)-dependent oxidoreductase n=1 Tax=Microbacterium sp. RD1 TaxID=3457313 RepID=UPI003FA5DDA7
MRTWFLTGASQGLGLELASQLLERGDAVAATTRSRERLLSSLDGVGTGRLLALEVELGDEQAVTAAVDRAAETFGRIDVVVNNAGYGLLGAVEDVSDAAVRTLFDVQVFGAWNVVRAALPLLRAQRSGHIVNVSSVLGLTAVPGWGAYCAAKFALEGMSEALAGEVAPYGVTVTIAEPGYLRTSFLTPGALTAVTHAGDAYQDIARMIDDHRKLQGNQLGDPAKAAAALVGIVDRGDTRLHQILGSDAYAYATAKVDALREDLEAGKELALTTDRADA